MLCCDLPAPFPHPVRETPERSGSPIPLARLEPKGYLLSQPLQPVHICSPEVTPLPDSEGVHLRFNLGLGCEGCIFLVDGESGFGIGQSPLLSPCK